MEPERNQSEELSRLWRHVAHETLDFNAAAAQALALQHITHEQVMAYYEEHFSRASPSRRCLTVEVWSHSAAKAAGVLSASDQHVLAGSPLQQPMELHQWGHFPPLQRQTAARQEE